MDFEKVYRVTSDTRLLGRAGSRREELYARVNNGLIAVFPKSSYDGLGGSASVPADTVWMLADTRVDGSGEPIHQATPLEPGPTSVGATLLDRRMNQRSLERSLTPEPLEPPPPPRSGDMDTSIPCVFGSEEVARSALLRYSGPGIGTGYASITRGRQSEIRLAAPAQLQGRVGALEGVFAMGLRTLGMQPVAGARVIGMGGGEHGIALCEAVTDSEGRFALADFSSDLGALFVRV
ncbi:MAG: hypothetical protein ACOYPS_11100, partial [Phycisphaerales bacterium]